MTPEPPENMREFGPPEPPEPGPEFGPERPPGGPRRRGRELNLPRRYTRWALWGCFTLSLSTLLIIGGFLLVMMRQAGFGTWMRFAENVSVCRQHLTQVSSALERYHADKGRLPDRLEDLWPTYMSDNQPLYCPAVPKPASGKTAAGTDYVLVPSIPWGKGREVVVYCPHHPAPMRRRDASEEQEIYQIPVIRQDGTLDTITGRLSDLTDPKPVSPSTAARR